MQNEEKTSGYKLRNFLLKLIVIIAIIALLIWLLPKFASYKKSTNKKNNNKSEIVSKQEGKYEANHSELKSAGLSYYSDDKLPQEIGEKNKISVEELKNKNILTEIKNANGKPCNEKESYVEITKLEKEYLLKTNLVFGDEKDYKIYHVGKYEHCNQSLCENTTQNEVEIETEYKETEHQDIPQAPNNNENKEESQEENKSENKDENKSENKEEKFILTEFGKWSNYERTSCNTKEIICQKDDKNCLQELKIYKRTEKIGDRKIAYKVTYPTLLQHNTKTKKLCSDYNYLEINGNLYYTSGNYGEILRLNKNTTSNWTYNGQVSLDKVPTSNINKYYKFIGVDEKSCNENCSETIKYYYDVYTYNHQLNLTTNKSCTNQIDKNYVVYTIENKTISNEEIKPIYATACYKSVRTRSVEKVEGE